MGDDDRVVLRSGLTGPAVSVAVSLLVVAAVSWALGDWFALWAVAGVVIGSLLSHVLRRVVLTSRGLEVWSFGYTFVAWSQVADVSVGGSWKTERYVVVPTRPTPVPGHDPWAPPPI